MKKQLCWILVLLLVSSANAAQNDKFPLGPQHTKWLQDVYWIISDYEKNAFESLKSNDDRDSFIKAFWENRDPTPGTAGNEFEEEYYKRLEYANEHFAESSLPGWKTDRGRVYLLLGKPQSVRRYPSFEVQPNELWEYVGLQQYGLPGALNLLFYWKNGAQPYKLYSPMEDGVRSLFVMSPGQESKSDDELLQVLAQNVHPNLAHACLTAIASDDPGRAGVPLQLPAEMMLSRLQNAGNYDISKRKYVDDFLNDRPNVQLYYSIGGEGIFDGLYWFQAPTGNFYIDYAIEYEPDKLELGQYDNYYTSLSLDGQITDANNVEVETIAGTYEIIMNKERFEKIRFMPFQLQSRRPLVPGKFAINLIIANNVSGRGATFVHDVDVPDMTKTTAPVLSPVMPLRTVENAPTDGKLRPFQFGDKLYAPNVPARYAVGSNMTVYNQVIFPKTFSAADLTLHYKILKDGQQEADFSDNLNFAADKPPGSAIDVRKDLPLKDFSSGTHQLRLELWAGAGKIAEAAPVVFTIDPEAHAGMWRYSVGIPNYDSSYHASTLAQQYLRENKMAEAEALLEAAYRKEPGSLSLQLLLMRATLKSRNFDRVIALGSPMETKSPPDKQLLWLVACAYYGKEKYEDAIRLLERLRKEDPNAVEVLNMLADIHHRLDRKDRTPERLKEPPVLNPDQN